MSNVKVPVSKVAEMASGQYGCTDIPLEALEAKTSQDLFFQFQPSKSDW